MIKLKFLVVLAAIFSTGFASDNMSLMNSFRFPAQRMSVEDYKNLPEDKKQQLISTVSDYMKNMSIFEQRNGFQNAVRHGYLREIDYIIGINTPDKVKALMRGVINEASTYPNSYPGFNVDFIKNAESNISRFDYNISSNTDNLLESLNISKKGSITSIAKQLEKAKNEVSQEVVSVAPQQVSKEPDQEVVSVAPQQVSKEPDQKVVSVAPQQVSKEPDQEVVLVAPQQVSKEPDQKVVSVAPAESNSGQVNVTTSAPKKQLSLSEIRKIQNEQFKDKKPTDAEKHNFLDSMGF